MASSPVLKQLCFELGLDCSNLTTKEMTSALREEADRRFNYKDVKLSADHLSVELRKFLQLEYDYIFKNKDGKKLNYDYIV